MAQEQNAQPVILPLDSLSFSFPSRDVVGKRNPNVRLVANYHVNVPGSTFGSLTGAIWFEITEPGDRAKGIADKGTYSVSMPTGLEIEQGTRRLSEEAAEAIKVFKHGVNTAYDRYREAKLKAAAVKVVPAAK